MSILIIDPFLDTSNIPSNRWKCQSLLRPTCYTWNNLNLLIIIRLFFFRCFLDVTLNVEVCKEGEHSDPDRQNEDACPCRIVTIGEERDSNMAGEGHKLKHLESREMYFHHRYLWTWWYDEPHGGRTAGCSSSLTPWRKSSWRAG